MKKDCPQYANIEPRTTNPLNSFQKTPLHFFFLLQFMKRNSEFICLYKIAPVAIILAATGVKLFALNLHPHVFNLLFYEVNVNGGNRNFFFAILLLFIGFNKIKFNSGYVPVFGIE